MTLRVTYCEPFNGRLALSAFVAAWLFKRVLTSPLYGKEITEQDLYDYMAQTPEGLARARAAMSVTGEQP